MTVGLDVRLESLTYGGRRAGQSMHLGIRAQLLFPLVPLVLGLAATTAWTAYSAASAARAQIFADLANIADTVQQRTFPQNAQILRLMKGLSRADLLLCDALGRPLPDDQGHPLTTLGSVPESLPKNFDAAEPTVIRVGDKDYLCRAVRLPHDTLYVFLPTSTLDEAVARAVRPALVIGGVGGALSLLLAFWVTQRLTRRILDVQRRTRLIAAGDFSPMPLTPQHDELRVLGQSINDMAQQLSRFRESAISTERLRLLGQVSGGLAHQLRNGIAGAKLALQLLAKEHVGKDVPESLEVALRQLALMENYLKRFFDLGKAMQVRPETVDLAALVDETVTLLRPQCVHAKIDFTVASPIGSTSLSADPEQLRQVLFNLMSNAIEAAGPNGRVGVQIRRGDQTIALDVVDSGPGLPEHVAARLFEPFVTGKPEGVGLGLAVSRQIVDAHGGTLSWSREPEGTRFRMELPAAPRRSGFPA